ncbi:hypothetical protein GCM10026988_03930 [Vibrio panuliri]
MEDDIAKVCTDLGSKDFVLCFSDSANWRKEVMPSYKANRLDKRKPLCLYPLIEYLKEKYPYEQRESLEADDIMGILATLPSYQNDRKKIIVSIDKDLLQIPAWHYNPNKDYQEHEVTQEEADRFYLCQAFAGDAVDGFSGCPTIGVETARTLIDEKVIYVPFVHTFKSGKRKGETEHRWQKVTGESQSAWETIVSTYRKHGLSESVALSNARVARICRACDYNFKNKEVKLWQPH